MQRKRSLRIHVSGEVVGVLRQLYRALSLTRALGVEVFSVRKGRRQSCRTTSERNYETKKNVVIGQASTSCLRFRHSARQFLLGRAKLHSMKYKNPSTLPEGAAAVVGTGTVGGRLPQNSINGRKVYLCSAAPARVPDESRQDPVIGYTIGILRHQGRRTETIRIRHVGPP